MVEEKRYLNLHNSDRKLYLITIRRSSDIGLKMITHI